MTQSADYEGTIPVHVTQYFATEIDRLRRENDRLRSGLADANDLCRSAASIADRHGLATNWLAWKAQIHRGLIEQHKIMYPEMYPPPTTSSGAE